jgi:hypothetical protein
MISGIPVSDPPADLFRARVRELERLCGPFFRSDLPGKSFILKAVVFNRALFVSGLISVANRLRRVGISQIS